MNRINNPFSFDVFTSSGDESEVTLNCDEDIINTLEKAKMEVKNGNTRLITLLNGTYSVLNKPNRKAF